MHYRADIDVPTPGRGFVDITGRVTRVVSRSGIADGLCNVFVRHTSASLILCENADPAVRRDLERLMTRLAPDGDPEFEHRSEGLDDMPAHARSVLTQGSISIPVAGRGLLLGTWQGIYLWEHRLAAQGRTLSVTVIGDP